MPEGFKLESGGLHKLLLGPFYLFEDVFGAFLPGVVFFALLLIKHVHLLENAFAIPYLGYKTKIVAGLVLAFVTGKVFQLPSTIALRFIENFESPNGGLVVKNIDRQKSVSDALAGRGKNFVSGFLVGLVVPNFDSIDQWVVRRGQISFYLTTGLVLVTAASFPGDGHLVSAERYAGVAFLLVGAFSAVYLRKGIITMLGVTAAHTVINSPPDYEKRAIGGLRLLFGKSLASLYAEIMSVPEKEILSASQKPPDNPTATGAAATKS